MASDPPTDGLLNTAGSSKSPYVRRHADSPVAWQPLNQDSLDRAARENKLVFLNIGSAPCHYAQLMSQDSWSRPAVADILNRHYIPIMVDKDERPDLDSIYEHYLMSIHGKVGYPVNLFLTDKLHPVYGDTYLEGPTDHDYDDVGEENPNIVFILKRVEKHWREERERLLAEGEATFTQLREILAEGTRSQPCSAPATGPIGPDVDIELEIMEEAYTGHAKLYDPVNAGFLSVPSDPTMPAIIPKFSMVSRLDYLLRLSHLPSAVRGVVGDAECENARKMTLETLRKMRDLTMHDHLGGGFHSSTQTRDWAFPLFDKVTGHNGQLLDLYLDAWLTTSSPEDRTPVNVAEVWRSSNNEFLDVVISLASYLTSPPICRPAGGFCTSEAADSTAARGGGRSVNGNSQLRAGAFYVWSKKDFLAAIDGVANGELAASFFNIKDGGNIDKVLDPRDEFITENVLSITGNEEHLASRHGISPPGARRDLARAKEALRRYREANRTRPATDTRVIAGENGKVIAALARAGAALRTIELELGDNCLAAASKSASLIKDKMWDEEEKTLYRILDGDEKQDIRGFAEDYAFLIDGLLRLYEATGELAWLSWADELQSTQISRFYDPRSSSSSTATTTSSSPPPTSSSIPTSADLAHCGGFYSTEHSPSPSSPFAIMRVKSAMDDVSPSVNGVSASNLFRLGSLLGPQQQQEQIQPSENGGEQTATGGGDKEGGAHEYVRLAKETILAFEVEMPVHPGLFTSLLVNLVTARMGTGVENGNGNGNGGGERQGRWLVFNKSPDFSLSNDNNNPANNAASAGRETGGDTGSVGGVRAAEELKKKFFTLPRAGLRTLIQLPIPRPGVGGQEEEDARMTSWLASRNTGIRELLGASREAGGAALDPDAAYVFDEGVKRYRVCTAEELERFGTEP